MTLSSDVFWISPFDWWECDDWWNDAKCIQRKNFWWCFLLLFFKYFKSIQVNVIASQMLQNISIARIFGGIIFNWLLKYPYLLTTTWWLAIYIWWHYLLLPFELFLSMDENVMTGEVPPQNVSIARIFEEIIFCCFLNFTYRLMR